MSLNWDDLRVFAAIAAHDTPKSAARALSMSLSTLYRRVAAAEVAVGGVCWRRGDEGQTLTPLGRRLAEVGRDTAARLRQFDVDRADEDRSLRGTVTFTTVHVLAPFLRGPIARLSDTHPGLVVELILGDNGPSVREREVDLALSIVPRPPPGCVGRRVAVLGCGVFGQPDVVGRDPLPWVRRSTAEASSPESKWEQRHVRAEQIAVRAPFHELVGLVSAGVGVGLVPDAIAATHGLVPAPSPASTGGLKRALWLLVHPERRHVPRIATVMRELAAGLTASFTDARKS